MSRNIERDVGIGPFLTNTPGIGGRLRKRVEDFIVREDFLRPPSDDGGKYSIATVRARNWETNRLVQRLSTELGIDRRNIGFAGTKDKRAITTQLMSFPAPPSRLKELAIKDIRISDLYRSNKGIALGHLIGNSFEIVIRDFSKDAHEIEEIFDENLKKIDDVGGFLNYFGIQRFGAIRPTTHLVGKKIVERDFEGAVMTYIGNPFEGEDPHSFEARELAEATRDWEKMIEIYPHVLAFERSMIAHLVKRPNDYIGALRRLPINLLMMFVHAYQSYYFNEIISRRVNRGIPLNEAQIGDIIITVDENNAPKRDRLIPVTRSNMDKIQRRIKERKAYISAPAIGADIELADGIQGEIEREILNEMGVDRRNFHISEIPRISSKGIRREILGAVNDLSYDINEKRIRLKFKLFKGCYATSFLREFIKSDDVRNY